MELYKGGLEPTCPRYAPPTGVPVHQKSLELVRCRLKPSQPLQHLH